MPEFQWAVVQSDPNPVIGSEQRGVRPVLVVSNPGANVATMG
ncbi:MAG: type II toxin-antitoxin system PemK/MazF family toxin [Chloroflexota bacterium]